MGDPVMRVSPSVVFSRAGWAEGLLGLRLAVTTALDRMAVRRATAQSHAFDDVRTFCLFIGYPRSGHSLVSSMIDAHSRAAIAHRLDAVRYVQEGLDLPAVWHLALRNSKRFASRGRTLTGYAYPIDGQGRHETLQVVGDQEGRKTAERLAADPELLARLAELPVAVKLIHVIRNPFDNITTWALRTNGDLASSASRYLALCRAVERIRSAARRPAILDVHYEDFLAAPAEGLRRVCAFLDLPASEEYLERCARIVYAKPHASRHAASWPERTLHLVKSEAKSVHYLLPYCDWNGR
jgi:hypothetical protein